MNDDMKLEEALRAHGPLGMPGELRARILDAARSERHRARRAWVQGLGLAAVVLAVVAIGQRIEQSEIETCRSLMGSPGPSRAEQEADRLAESLAAVLDGEGSTDEITRQLRARLRVESNAFGILAFRERAREESNLLKEE